MNKALHVLVYLFLILSAAALWFEIELNKKRTLLTDRNEMQEDYIVRIASTVEKVEPNKDATTETKKDVSPIEAKIVDIPETENVLEDYNAYLEQANLETFSWDNQPTRAQLRNVYVLDHEGKVVMDGVKPLMKGAGTEHELLEQLLDGSSKMRAKLDTTRAELVKLHGILDEQVAELNKLKPEARQDKVTIVEKTEKIAKLEETKADLENQIVKIKAQIDELNAEITSLKDEVVTAQDETAAAKEELQKSQKLVEQLKKLIQEMINERNRNNGDPNNITSLPAGDKGKVIEADNENMFAVVEFDAKTMKELKGDNLDHPIPNIELGVKRPGFHGEAGEFVGRIRLRQEVREKNYIICDILGPWKQDDIKPDDIIFAD
jgi:outer membrane murein-binding lipoprotein Lpp